jgi:hypothetical protein
MADDPTKHADDHEGVNIYGDHATDFCAAPGVSILRLQQLAKNDQNCAADARRVLSKQRT